MAAAPPPLAAPIRDLAIRLGAEPKSPPARVSLSQQGRMRQNEHSRWMRFRANHSMSVTQCSFDWRASFGPAGLIRVRDALLDGEGILTARLFGFLPVAQASGPEATKGELMRYLAELSWCPDAILHNRAIGWTVVSQAEIVATAQLGETVASVWLALDREGRIESISAPDRPRSRGKEFIPTSWWGRFSDYRSHAGRQIPFRGEVGWEGEGERVTVWEGEVLDWTLVA